MADNFAYHLVGPGQRVLCAVSGGADSMYLLCRLLERARRGGYQVGAAHYNHGIRQASCQEEDFVRRWCRERGVPLYVGHGDVPQQARARGRGLEETARDLRYAFLYETARQEGYTLIATGHHAGDQAETVLMHLIRGSGLRGLCGIPPVSGALVRPMLEVTRAQVEEYLRRRNIPHVEDESNADPAYTRNRVRHEVMPLLEQLNPQAVVHIAQLTAKLRADADLLDRQAQALTEGMEGEEPGLVDIPQLLAAPRPLAVRSLGQRLQKLNIPSAQVYLDGLMELMEQGRSGACLDLPGHVARRSWDQLHITPAGPGETLPDTLLQEGVTTWGPWRVECRSGVCPPDPGEGLWLVPGEYVLRRRQVGDRLKLPGRPTKTVKKLMIEEKIPAALRPCLPVLSQGERVAAVACLGVDRDFLARPGQLGQSITMIKERDNHA